MNITITRTPENYSSAMMPALYTLSAEPDGNPLDVTVMADGGIKIGSKRFPAADTAEINTSCYLRRMLDPHPIAERGCGFRLPEGRTVVSYIGSGEVESEPRLFTAALRTVALFELLNKRGTEREIWRGDCDEITLLVEPATLTAEVVVMGADRRECVGNHKRVISSACMAAFVTDTDEILSSLSWADEAERIEVTIEADGEMVAKVTYRLEHKPSDGITLCWLNTLGAYDCMSFHCSKERTMTVTKERMLAAEGYRTLSVQTEERRLLLIPPLPSREMSMVGEMVASPRLFIVTDEGYEAADVMTERITVWSHKAGYTEMELRISKRGETQKF